MWWAALKLICLSFNLRPLRWITGLVSMERLADHHQLGPHFCSLAFEFRLDFKVLLLAGPSRHKYCFSILLHPH
jgi:hypothetical protein